MLLLRPVTLRSSKQSTIFCLVPSSKNTQQRSEQTHGDIAGWSHGSGRGAPAAAAGRRRAARPPLHRRLRRRRRRHRRRHAGSPGRMERGLRHTRQGRPQRARRKVLPGLARHARRAMPGRDQALHFREYRRAGEPGRVGATRRRQVAALLPGAGPVGERRRRHRRPRAAVVGTVLQGEAPQQRQALHATSCSQGASFRGMPRGPGAGRDRAEQPAAAPDLHSLHQRQGELPQGELPGEQPRHRRHPPRRLQERPSRRQPHLHRWRLRVHGGQLHGRSPEIHLLWTWQWHQHRNHRGDPSRGQAGEDRDRHRVLDQHIQRRAHQDLAGWVRLRPQGEVPEHRHEERVEPHRHRPVPHLQPPSRPLRSDPGDERGGGGEDRLRGHRGHVGDEAGGDIRVQRRRAVQAGVAAERQPDDGRRARARAQDAVGILPRRVREEHRRRCPRVVPRHAAQAAGRCCC